MSADVKRLRRKYWLIILGWVGIIYSTLYIVRPVCTFLKQVTPFAEMMNIFVFAFLGFVIFMLLRSIRVKDVLTYVLLGVVVLLYVYAFQVIEYPEEQVHLIEYGFLSYLIFNAFRLDVKSSLAYAEAFILTSLFGWGDEGIQHLLPNRYYQNADVILNSVSSILGLFLTFIVQRGKESSK